MGHFFKKVTERKHEKGSTTDVFQGTFPLFLSKAIFLWKAASDSI